MPPALAGDRPANEIRTRLAIDPEAPAGAAHRRRQHRRPTWTRATSSVAPSQQTSLTESPPAIMVLRSAWTRGRLDGHRRLKSGEVKSDHALLRDGSPYLRLAARDDRPVPHADEKKEQDRPTRSVADSAEKESAVERAACVSEYDSSSHWQREAWHELPEDSDAASFYAAVTAAL